MKTLISLNIKNYGLLILLLISCTSPSDKIKKIILYNDSIGYWNYEWTREGAAYSGFTFKFNKEGKVSKYSYSKVKNKRWLFADYGTLSRLEWGVANDSILTLMNYNSKIKIVKYNNDTIWLYNEESKTEEILIRVKGELNIEK